MYDQKESKGTNGWTESKKKRSRARIVGEKERGREACFEWQKIKTKDFLWGKRERERESDGLGGDCVFATRAD